MNDSVFETVEKSSQILKLDFSSTEFARLAEEQELTETQIEAVGTVLEYLQRKKIDTTIHTLLKMSRLPLKDPKTFDNFDFSVIKGRDATKLKTLPSLSAIYAHRNLAFIGPAGTGKPHLAQAFGYKCCQRGIKTYFIKMSELRDKFAAARRDGKEASILNGLGFVNNQTAIIFGISKNPAVSQNDLILNGLLMAEFHTAAQLAKLILGDGGHDGKAKLGIFIQGVDVVILEENTHTVTQQLTGKLDGVQGVAGKSGNFLGDDKIKFVLSSILNHTVEILTLFRGDAGQPLVNITGNKSPVFVALNEIFVVGDLIAQ